MTHVCVTRVRIEGLCVSLRATATCLLLQEIYSRLFSTSNKTPSSLSWTPRLNFPGDQSAFPHSADLSWTPLFQISMLTIPELIKNKRDGRVLSDEDIRTFIQMVTNKSIQEAQIGVEGLRKLFFVRGLELIAAIFFCGQEPCSWPSGRRE